MRIKLNTATPETVGNDADPKDIYFTGPLILYGNPLGDKEAATKTYVDSLTTSGLNASDMRTGIILPTLMPKFSGDVTNQTGSNNFTLPLTGVDAGTYTKITVNAKGFVTQGRSLEHGDLPELTWSKVLTGKPNSLSGYGITDSVSTAGGAVGEGFKIQSTPTEELHLVTREYVQSSLGDMASNAVPGTIVPYGTDEGVEGFLRCNGGYLLKSEYPDLYNVIGDKYSNRAGFGYSVPWQQQYYINQSGTIEFGEWETERRPSSALKGVAYAITKNKIYAIGGYTTSPSAPTTSVQVAKIYADGTIGEWEDSVPLPAALHSARTFIYNNNLYVVGGIWASGASKTIYRTTLDQEGAISTWVNSGSFNGDKNRFSVIRTNASVIRFFGTVVGGSSTPTSSSGYFMVSINTYGTISDTSSVSYSELFPTGSDLISTKFGTFATGGNTGTLTDPVPTNKISAMLTRIGNGDLDQNRAISSVPANTAGISYTVQFEGQEATFNGGTFPANKEMTEHVFINEDPSAYKNLSANIPEGGFLTMEYDSVDTISTNITNVGEINIPTEAEEIFVELNPQMGFHVQEEVSPGYKEAEWGSGFLYIMSGQFVTLEGIQNLRNNYSGHNRLHEVDSISAQLLDNLIHNARTDPYARHYDPNGKFEVHFIEGENTIFTVNGQQGRYINLIKMVMETGPYTTRIPYMDAVAPADSTFTYNGQTWVAPHNGYNTPEKLRFSFKPVPGVTKATLENNAVIGNVARRTFYVNTTYYKLRERVISTRLGTGNPLNISIPTGIDKFKLYGKGSNWLQDLPFAICNHSTYTTNDKVYIFGGHNSTKIYVADIDKYGMFHDWREIASLPYIVSNSSLLASQNKLYLANDDGIISIKTPAGTADYSGFFSDMSPITAPEGYFALPDFYKKAGESIYYYIKY